MYKSGENLAFKYDYNGYRIKKSYTDGATTDYMVDDGGKLLGMKQGTSTLWFTYEANGEVVGFDHEIGGVFDSYYYLKNAQGDIIGIAAASGNQVVSYAYDAWGRQVSMTDSTEYLGEMNPLRYRGYIYDEETGLYYLQSRYYDPETGRFINADGSMYEVGVTGFNLFQYCANNPATLTDPTGKWFGFDDVFTGPVDEIVVLGGLSILGLFGVGWAQDAADGISKGLSDLWDGMVEGIASCCDGITIAFKEHEKNARPSSRNKHEEGQTRKQMDKGGEKGDKKRTSRSNKRNRTSTPVIVPPTSIDQPSPSTYIGTTESPEYMRKKWMVDTGNFYNV